VEDGTDVSSRAEPWLREVLNYGCSLAQRVGSGAAGHQDLCQRLPRRLKGEVIRAEETKVGINRIEGINRIVKERNPLKPMKKQLRQLPWKLIFILALIQLTRPILSTAGFFDGFRPQGPIIATVLIALIWIGVAVIGNVREPVKVLAMAGATYAVLGVAMAVFLQTFFAWSPEETVSIPLLLTAGLIGGIVVNVIWGALLGFLATGVKKAVKS
jgi:hypothetical protein